LRWDISHMAAMRRLAGLRAEANYPRAVRTFARNMLNQGELDEALDGILKDAGRNVAAKCLAYLDVTGGLTLPRLKALCASTGMVSPGRARALLLYLRYLGYAVPVPGRTADGATLYKPTVGFQRTWRAHMSAILEAAEVLEPAVGLVMERFDDVAVYETFVRCISEGYLEGLNHIDPESAYFKVFMHRYAGVQIMHTLLVSAADEDFPPRASMEFCVATAARRFRVSEVHVRRLLRAGEQHGLLRLPRPGVVLLKPAGRDAVDEVFATQMAVFLIAAARTLAASLGRAERRSPEAGLAASPG
jgi:hypothetical protein